MIHVTPTFHAEQAPASATLPAASVSERRTEDYLYVVQDLLAYAARCPVPVPDRANGRTHAQMPGVVKVPFSNAEGCWALVDAEDYPLVQRYRWRMDADGYAIATDGQDIVRMHRLVLMLGATGVVDHRNHEPADNRKANLRVCTHAENMRNARTRSSTGVKGVTRDGSGYLCSITKDGQRFTKNHQSFEAACAWIAQKRGELHGEFACADTAGGQPC